MSWLKIGGVQNKTIVDNLDNPVADVVSFAENVRGGSRVSLQIRIRRIINPEQPYMREGDKIYVENGAVYLGYNLLQWVNEYNRFISTSRDDGRTYEEIMLHTDIPEQGDQFVPNEVPAPAPAYGPVQVVGGTFVMPGWLAHGASEIPPIPNEIPLQVSIPNTESANSATPNDIDRWGLI